MARKNRYIKQDIRNKVLKIADGYCEYCKSRDDFSTGFFEFDHIIPIADGGSNEFKNIARSCGLCNGNKSDKTNGFDTITQKEYPLFHPRKHKWEEHFRWSDDFTKMIALSPIGRVTIEVLELNRPNLINIRKALLILKKHPPK